MKSPHRKQQAKIPYDMTPLTRAIYENDIPLVNKLLSEGADVNEIDDWFHSPLLEAIYHERVEIVKILLAHPEIDIEMVESECEATPFMSAALVRNIEIAQCLIDAGANIHAKTIDGSSAIKYLHEVDWDGEDPEADKKEANNKTYAMIAFLTKIGIV
jgi:ankyrin repeat protein